MIRKLLKNYWPTCIVFLAVLWLTLAPHPVPDNKLELFEGADKVVHAIMMGGLAITLIFDYSRGGTRKPSAVGCKPLLIMAGAVAVFAVGDEYAQSAMGLGRTTDILDLYADLFGILLSFLVSLFVSKRL